MTMLGRSTVGAALIAAVAALAAGCGGKGTAVAFRTAPADQQCLIHQTRAPTRDYEGGATAVSEVELPFLAYYTTHGDQPFCDGKKATSKDRQWADLYVKLTDNAAKVRTIRY